MFWILEKDHTTARECKKSQRTVFSRLCVCAAYEGVKLTKS